MQWRSLLVTTASPAVILPRLSVGAVFLSEGIQKFLFPDRLGVGRFEDIGIPAPEVMAPSVGVFEIGCGVLLLLGLVTRLAAIPMIIDMLVAIATTKIPILMDDGFWAMAHEARTDWAQLLGSIFLLAIGIIFLLAVTGASLLVLPLWHDYRHANRMLALDSQLGSATVALARERGMVSTAACR